jgi:hypothetical protein
VPDLGRLALPGALGHALGAPILTYKGLQMSILQMEPWIENLCQRFDLYEYRILILVKLPDGKQFLTDSADVANRAQAELGAETVHVTELGE